MELRSNASASASTASIAGVGGGTASPAWRARRAQLLDSRAADGVLLRGDRRAAVALRTPRPLALKRVLDSGPNLSRPTTSPFSLTRRTTVLWFVRPRSTPMPAALVPSALPCAPRPAKPRRSCGTRPQPQLTKRASYSCANARSVRSSRASSTSAGSMYGFERVRHDQLRHPRSPAAPRW